MNVPGSGAKIPVLVKSDETVKDISSDSDMEETRAKIVGPSQNPGINTKIIGAMIEEVWFDRRVWKRAVIIVRALLLLYRRTEKPLCKPSWRISYIEVMLGSFTDIMKIRVCE